MYTPVAVGVRIAPGCKQHMVCNGWMDRQMDIQTDGRTDRQMDKQTDRQNSTMTH